MTFVPGSAVNKLGGRKGYEYEKEQYERMKRLYDRYLNLTDKVLNKEADAKDLKAYETVKALLLKIVDKLHPSKQQTEISGELNISKVLNDLEK